MVKVEILESGNVGKFSIGKVISKSAVTYESAAQAQRSPLASKIFGFPWTQKVQVGQDYVIVEKQDWVDWEVLAEPLSGLIQEHIEERLQKVNEIEENPELREPDLSHPLAERIFTVIDNEINPAVAEHGGYIRLIDVKDDKVFIQMEGGCHGCGMSKLTLTEGITETLKKYFPEIKDVVDVTDHALGTNPYA